MPTKSECEVSLIGSSTARLVAGLSGRAVQAVSRPRAEGAGRIVAAVLLAIGLAGCGGGGGSPAPVGPISTPTATLLGTFTDAPVVGATYSTSSGSGGCTSTAPCTTDKLGQFKYAAGDTVTFSAAGVTLGATGALNPATDGTTVVTPVTLVSGATAATEAGPTAIAQFLQTLSTVSAGTSGNGGPGVLTMPTDAATLSKLSGAGILSTSSVTSIVSTLQTALDAAFGANHYTVVPAAAAQAALTQGVNSNGIIGTVWAGTCAVNQCGGGSASGTATIYFQPNGTLTGFSEGNLLAGSWSGSTTSSGGVSVQITNGKGGYATGTFSSTAGTATVAIYNSSGAPQGSFTFNKVVAPSLAAVTNTQYAGGWYATFTPNAATLAGGNKGGTAYIVVAPDGKFYGITDGGGHSFSGTWDPTTGLGSAAWTDNSGQAVSIAIDLTAGSGTVSFGGQAAGTLSFSRTGTLTNNQNSSAAPIPLLLNVVVSWANNGNTVSSLALALSAYDSNGKQVASTVKSESTAPLSTGVRTTTTDNIAVPYPTGGAATYTLSVGPSNCTMTGNSGSIVDAYSGKASAYPTVYITCDPTSVPLTGGGSPIPLLLNVVTNWGTVYPSPGYGLALMVKDAGGNQIASGFIQQNVNLTNSSGVVMAATTTNNIAASYPKGSGVTYSLTTGSAYCTITGGGGGNVVDASSGNATLYPTVTVHCD